MPASASKISRIVLFLLALGGLASHAVAQLPGSVPGLGQPAATPYSVAAYIVPAADNNPAMLVVTATIEPTWHIYSVTQPPGGPVRTKITLDADQPATLAGDFVADPAPSKHEEPAFNGLTVEAHEKSVTWTAPLELPAGVDPNTLVLTGKAFIQACTDKNCLPPQNNPFQARVVAPVASAPTVTAPAASTAPAVENAQPQAMPNTTRDLGQPAASKPEVAVPRAADLALPRSAKSTVTKPIAEANPATEAKGATTAPGPYQPPTSHLVLEGRIEPQTVEPGSRAELRIKATPSNGWYVYALASRAPAQGPKPTLIRLTTATPCTDMAPRASEKPQTKKDNQGGVISYHPNPVEWTIDLCIPENAEAGPLPIEGLIGFMTCTEGGCDVPRAARFKGIVNVGSETKGGALVLAFADAKYGEVERIAAAEAPPSMQATKGVTPAMTLQIEDRPPSDLSALPTMILYSLLGGLILNLMPCVLPVIGLKVYSFVEQAGESRRVALQLNLWYTLGVVAVFMVLATLASAAKLGLAESGWSWGQQNSSITFNIVMCSIVFVMSLSFLGVWEMPIPGFVGSSKTTNLAAREGWIGAFSKGAITTILATPCTGPFLSTVFGFTLTQPPAITYLIFACIGLGMSLPYLLIGGFPGLIRFLPKPGAWMETFKQAMGFVMMGAIVFLFTAMPKRDYLVPTFCLLIGLWAGCWWIGRTPLYAGAQKLFKAYAIGGLIAAIVGVAGFKTLLPGESLIAWQPFSQAALEKATAEGKTVMVDFTADWCLVCKTNMKFAINTHDVSSAVHRGNVVPLIVDLTDYESEHWKMLNALGQDGIPLLAIFPAQDPKKPIILDNILTEGIVLEALEKAGPSNGPRTALKPDR
jgi:thiol:disulfide interchange protein